MRFVKLSIFALTLLFLLTAQVLAGRPIQRDEADSYDVSEAQYRWLEIEDVGDAVVGLGDNEFAGPYDIGFDFPFFGQTYNSFYITSNGFIGFGPTDDYETAVYQSLPDVSRPNNLIAPLWKNFNPSIFWGEGAIYYGIREGNLVVEFQRFPEVFQEGHSPDNTITMQVVLKPDGDILFQYQEVGQSFDLNHGVIGVEGPGGEDGITVRFDGEGSEVASGTAFLISEHGPGDFLIWDGGSRTTSGDEQESALRAGGHSIAHLRLRVNQALPEDLRAYEGVFVNLGNYGVDGRGYHQLTDSEGRILADYLDAGGSLYLEGSDFWTRDNPTDVHEYFKVEGISDGRAAEAPITGIADGFAEGLRFDAYDAADNDFVDQLRPIANAVPIFTFHDANATPVGMIAFNGRPYRTVASSFEFGGLVDGQNGTKAELAERIVSFFRSAPPDFFPPTNLRATVGDGQVALRWAYIERGRDQAERQNILHQIAALTPRNGEKPSLEARSVIRSLKAELSALEVQAAPRRDALHGFNIYLDDQLYDFTNGLSYTLLELQNGREYRLKVTAIYRDPDGESESTDEVIAVPTDLWRPPQRFDFEQFNGALVPQPVAGGWEWGHPAVGAAGGERAWGTLLDQNYPDLANFILSTPIINLTAQRQVTLAFNHFYSCEAGWDGGRLEISRDGGERWDILTPVGGYPDQAIFALDENAGFTGASGGWRRIECDLSPYAGEQVIVRFRFASDESEHGYPGWFIDDLSLYVPQVGNLNVRILNNNDGAAVQDVWVSLGNLHQDSSDVQGWVRFFDIAAGRYQLRVTKEYYSPVEQEVEVLADSTLSVDVGISVYASELRLPDGEGGVDVEMESGDRTEQQRTLMNVGAQVTDYQLYINFGAGGAREAVIPIDPPDDEPRRDNPWELFRTINLSQATNNQFITCAEMIKSGAPREYRFYVGGGGFEQANTRFHRLRRNGSLEATVSQGINDPEGWGVRDFAYDGQLLYGSYNNRIYPIDPANGGFQAQLLTTPLAVNRAIAYVPEDNSLWIGDRDNTWYKYEKRANGRMLDRYSQHGLTGVVGMAWNPSDPDGACLYVHNQEPDGGAALYRFNPRTRQLIRQMTTVEPGQGTAGGAFVTYLYDTQNWTLGLVIQGADGDYLKLYELWPRRSYLRVTPATGQIASGGSVNLNFAFDATGLIESVLTPTVIVEDLRNGSEVSIDVTCAVHGDAATQGGEVTLDAAGDVQAVVVSLNDRVTNPQEEGDYSFEGLLPGRYLLRASLAGFHSFVSDSFDLAANQNHVTNIRLLHDEMGTIRGRIHSVYGEDSVLVGVEVAALLQGSDTLYALDTTDENGLYEMNVPMGSFDLTARKRGWASVTEEGIQIDDGGEVEINFELDDHLPIHSLRADGDWDDRIKLSWAPPGTYADSLLLQLDNNVAANGIYLRGRDDMVATRFEPDGLFDVLSITVNFVNGWPNGQLNEIGLSIFDEDPETGLPNNVLWTGVFAAQRAQGWATLRVADLRFLEGPFFVGWQQGGNNAASYDAVTLDNNFDFPGSTFLRLDGAWRRFDGLPGEQFVRALIWQYNDREERNLTPRPVTSNEAIDFEASGVAVYTIPESERPASDDQIGASLFQPTALTPSRDAPVAYQVFVDEQMVTDTVQTLGWSHIVGSEGENQLHTYQIVAVYGDNENQASPELEQRCNWPPDTLRAPQISYNGVEYTLRWTLPMNNLKGRGQCIDYAGTEIALDGEVIATVDNPNTTFTGRIEEGEEGLHTVRLIGFDEIPNRGPAREVTFPIGLGQILDFETNRPTFFTVSPVASWSLDSVFPTPPRTAHSGRSAFGTRPRQGRYDNNVNYMATTTAEYYVSSPTARVEFYQFISAEAGHDGGRLMVSVDGGAFQLLRPEGDYNDQTVAAFDNGPAFTGTNGGWQLVRADLTQFRGHTIKLRFHFASDESINWYPGWFIDDLYIWGVAPPVFGQIYGFVKDQNENAIPDATVTSGNSTATTAEDGAYRLTNLIPGQISVSASKAGYMPVVQEMEINARDSVQVDLELYRPALSVDVEAFQYELGGNDRLETEFTLTNGGEHPVPYIIQLLGMNPDRDAEDDREIRSLKTNEARRDRPGSRQFDYDATTISGQRRIMGAEFADDQFFLTSADPDRGFLVSVINRDGALVRTFQQPQGRRLGWGLRDLAYDGEFLYGSQNDSIYCFNTQGVLQSQQLGAPLTVNRALAYDEVHDGFWAAEWDSPWYLVSREGRISANWAGHGLSGVYGLAYHPADPEGMPIYALNLEADGSTAIYRANPDAGTIERLYQFEGPPTGCFLTGSWDANRWILGAITGNSPQRLVGIELGQRISWIGLNPTEGELEAGESQQVVVTFLVPPEAAQGDNFQVDISIRAFDDQQAVIRASIDIIEGFRHFDEPVASEQHMTYTVSSAQVYGREIPVGSEIALLTPRDEVGGVIRWIDAPEEIIASIAQGAFEVGDTVRILIWDAVRNQEFIPEVVYTAGQPVCGIDAEATVELVVRRPDTQTVTLAQGWTLMSSYITPFVLEAPVIFADVRERDHVILVKDGSGRFWAPRHEFNGLREWNPLGGYHVYLSAPDSVKFEGVRVPADRAIQLGAGWNQIGYLLDGPVNAQIGFEVIMNDVIIAKNGRGDFLSPRHGYYGLRTLRPGEGYKVNVSRAVELVYHNAGRLAFLPPVEQDDPESLPVTGADMSLLVTDVPRDALGDESYLVVYAGTPGRIVGQTKLSAIPAGLAIRGDDTLTSALDGAKAGETLSVMVVRDGKMIASLPTGSSVSYETDGFAAVSLSSSVPELPVTLALNEAYPNPFNGKTIIRYGMPVDGERRITVRDLSGRLMWDSGLSTVSAGWHEAAIDADVWPSGIYWAKLASNGASQTIKLVLVR